MSAEGARQWLKVAAERGDPEGERTALLWSIAESLVGIAESMTPTVRTYPIEWRAPNGDVWVRHSPDGLGGPASRYTRMKDPTGPRFTLEEIESAYRP